MYLFLFNLGVCYATLKFIRFQHYFLVLLCSQFIWQYFPSVRQPASQRCYDSIVISKPFLCQQFFFSLALLFSVSVSRKQIDWAHSRVMVRFFAGSLFDSIQAFSINCFACSKFCFSDRSIECCFCSRLAHIQRERERERETWRNIKIACDCQCAYEFCFRAYLLADP